MDMDTKTKDASIWKRMQPIGRTHIGIILFICLGMRIALFGLFHPWTPKVDTEKILQKDALEYHQLAISLIENHRFAYAPQGKPDSFRVPLYPVFIAGIYSLFGYKPWIVLLVQIILDTMACILLLFFLSRLFNPRVAFIASLLYALDPFLILYSSTALLSDTFFVFLFIFAFYFWSAGVTAKLERNKMLSYGLSSFFMGLATLVRPISQYIFIFPVAFFLLFYWKDHKALIKYSVLSVLVFVLTLSPWLFRNYNQFGSFFLSDTAGYSLIDQTVSTMEMFKWHEGIDIVKKSLQSEADKMIEADGFHPGDLNRVQIGQYYKRLAIRYIVNNPLNFVKAYLQGIFRYFFNMGTLDYAKVLDLPMKKPDGKKYANLLDIAKNFVKEKGISGLLIAGIIAPYMLLSYLGTIIGIVVSWRRYDRRILSFILLLAMYFVLITGSGGIARYKLPSIPFYLPFAGIGFGYVWVWLLNQRKKRSICSAGL